MFPTIAEKPDALLDLFSTSQKSVENCRNNAPYLCIPPTNGKHGSIFQLCCNDWQCPRCGLMRAKHEYGRIVEGMRTLHKQGRQSFMLTLTCDGSEDADTADQKYYERTNRLLAALRYQVKKVPGGHWCYVQVTERQQRGHPHSHLLCAGVPGDAFSPFDDYELYVASVGRINAAIPYAQRFTPLPYADFSHLDLHSEWLMLAAVKAGLGVQARISRIDLVEGASRYVAKYLFKSNMFTEWPRKWKRIRYSQNFPKQPDATNKHAFPLLNAADWQRAAQLVGTLDCHWQPTYEKAVAQHCYNVEYVAPVETVKAHKLRGNHEKKLRAET